MVVKIVKNPFVENWQMPAPFVAGGYLPPKPPKCEQPIHTPAELVKSFAAVKERTISGGGQYDVAWTVSGGEQYMGLLEQAKFMWDKQLAIPSFIIALDEPTAQAACGFGWPVALWTEEKQTYSKVAGEHIATSKYLHTVLTNCQLPTRRR